MELTSKQRAQLRGLANSLTPIVHIGKEGITEAVVKQTNEALEARELIKCRVLESALLTAREACDELAQRTRSEGVQAIGSKFVLYRQSHNKEKKNKIELVKDKDFSINVISKSGTTTEPAVAFRIFKALLEEKYGKEGARRRIYATTDAHKGALKGLADAEGYEEFVVPDAVGGRYSVLTAVGLLPIACAGVDIAALMEGAAQAMEALAAPGADNPAWQYAAARHALYTQGKKVEILVGYEPSFRFFGEWWKQLFGESEGKDGKALFPASVEFTADLHSMGQYIQQGERLMLETVVRFARSRGSVTIPHDPDNVDGLNFLAGKDLSFVAEQAMRGTLLAHVDGGVPNLVVTAPARDAQSVGWLIYFFEYACGLSGYLLEINPFDQPGVEAYKNNMYALLGKPGYEDRKAELEARL